MILIRSLARRTEGDNSTEIALPSDSIPLPGVAANMLTPAAIYFASKLPKTRSSKMMRRILKAVDKETAIGDVTTLEGETSGVER